MDKKTKKTVIIVLIIAVIAILVITGIIFLLKVRANPNYLLDWKDKELTLDQTVKVEFSSDKRDFLLHDGIPVFSFIPEETAEYQINITDIQTAEDVVLSVFVIDEKYTEYMAEDNHKDNGDIVDKAILPEDTKCYVIIEAKAGDSSVEKYSGVFKVCMSRAETEEEIPEIKANESIGLVLQNEQQKSVKFTPEATDYYNFVPEIISANDRATIVYINSITDDDNNEIEHKDGICYLKEGRVYYIQVKASDVKGKKAEVRLTCSPIQRTEAEGNGVYSVSDKTIIEFTSKEDGMLAIYSVSDGKASSQVYDSKGFPIASDSGSGGDISGNKKDFALVLQAEKGSKYYIYVEGVFLTCDVYITDYIGDGSSLGKEDIVEITKEESSENTEASDAAENAENAADNSEAVSTEEATE